METGWSFHAPYQGSNLGSHNFPRENCGAHGGPCGPSDRVRPLLGLVPEIVQPLLPHLQAQHLTQIAIIIQIPQCIMDELPHHN